MIKDRGLITVHCWYKAEEEARISLFPNTYLWDQSIGSKSRKGHQSQLVYVDGIAIFPNDQIIPFMDTARFNLYFEPLPPECMTFWLWEQTQEPFTFECFDISRSETDEYWVEVIAAPF